MSCAHQRAVRMVGLEGRAISCAKRRDQVRMRPADPLKTNPAQKKFCAGKLLHRGDFVALAA
jgi:hypothetical protein